MRPFKWLSMRPIGSRKGFLILEVLVAVCVLSVAFVVFLGVLAQAIKVSARSARSMEAVGKFETLWFDLQCGLRPDLVRYGGRGNAGDGYFHEIEIRTDNETGSLLAARIWFGESSGSKEALVLDAFVLAAPIA